MGLLQDPEGDRVPLIPVECLAKPLFDVVFFFFDALGAARFSSFNALLIRIQIWCATPPVVPRSCRSSSKTDELCIEVVDELPSFRRLIPQHLLYFRGYGALDGALIGFCTIDCRLGEAISAASCPLACSIPSATAEIASTGRHRIARLRMRPW